MMLELSPDRSFGVLSPAFLGNEGYYALQGNADKGCTFLKEGQCEIHECSFFPLECRFCHHERWGQGAGCHRAIERDWQCAKGRRLVTHWLSACNLASPF